MVTVDRGRKSTVIKPSVQPSAGKEVFNTRASVVITQGGELGGKEGGKQGRKGWE